MDDRSGVVDLSEMAERTKEPPKEGHSWGFWRLESDGLQFTKPGWTSYRIQLEDFRTAWDFQRWLAHLSGKRRAFMSAEDIGNLVLAFNALVGIHAAWHRTAMIRPQYPA